MRNCKSLFKQILPWERTKNLPRTTTFGWWSFYRGVLSGDHLSQTTTFEWSQEWSFYTGLTVFLVNGTHSIFTLSVNALKTIDWCFATCFFLRIFFLHKNFLLFNRYIIKYFFKENIWQNDNRRIFLWKVYLVSPELLTQWVFESFRKYITWKVVC